MALKDKLSQYELDTVLAVLRNKKLNINDFSGKRVAVSGGGELQKLLVYSLVHLSEEKKLNMQVVSVDMPISTLYEDEVFSVRTTDELGDTDIFIDCGFLSYSGDFDGELFKESIQKASKTAATFSKNKVGRVVLLSSAAVYGKPEKELSLSENEYAQSSFALDNIGAVTFQCVENIFASAAHQYGFDIVILRSAALIAPIKGVEVSKKLLLPIINKEELSVLKGGKKTGYIYLNDLISALCFVALCGKNGEAYNAAGDDSSMSPLMLAAVAEELFGAGVKLSENGINISGCSLSCDKLKKLGWTPLVNAKDGLLIAFHALLNDDKVFMFSDSYDGKLSAVQGVLLGFLKEVDRICKKHSIKYFLGGGSLLGAVRHKGFIPWDDDADVMMLRDDYERFLSVLPKELPSYITDQNTDPYSHFAFTKLRLDDTLLSTEFSARFEGLHNGVFLDVLAQDKTSDNRFFAKLHIKKTAQLRWLVLNKWRKTPMNANNKIVSFIGDVIKAILPLSLLERMQNRTMTKYRSKHTQSLYDSMGRNVERGAFPAEWLDEAIYVDFEDTKLPIPKEWDKYLTYLYGDYMRMIPVSERHVSHDIVRIDLGRFINY